MRLWQRLSVLSLASLPAGTTSAAAYHFQALKWPGGVVPYYNAAPDQGWAVGQAVDAWNTSGAKIRFVAVPRAEAKLVIEEQTNKVYCAEGRASIGYYPRGAFVLVFPARGLPAARGRPPDPAITSFVVPFPWQSRTSFAVASYPAAGLRPTCSSDRDPLGEPRFRWNVRPGRLERLTTTLTLDAGCYAVWAVDELGRPSGRPATVRVATG